MTSPTSDTLEYGHSSPGDWVGKRLAQPPGWIFLSLSLGVAGGMLCADSEDSVFLTLFFIFVGFNLGIVWVTRVIVHAFSRESLMSWRWFCTPVIALATVILTFAEVPFRVRFSISEQALTNLAIKELAKPAPNGLGALITAGGFDLELSKVDKAVGRIDFVLPNAGLVDVEGLTYSPKQAPTSEQHKQYSPIGNGWYQSVERF